MGLLSKLIDRAASAPVSRDGVRLPGGANVEVKGESHYQDALEVACGGKCEEGHHLAVTAVLVPEPHNPYDSNAVQVCVDGRVVGYLSRAAAAAYAPILRRRTTTYTCAGTIVGGWVREDCDGIRDEGHFGITLDLASPSKLGL